MATVTETGGGLDGARLSYGGVLLEVMADDESSVGRGSMTVQQTIRVARETATLRDQKIKLHPFLWQFTPA